MNEAIEQLCKQLRLAYIAEEFEEIPFTTPDEFVLKLLLKERDGREQAKASRNIKKARFLEYKVLENYEWHKEVCLPSHLTKEELMNLDFIHRHENIILVGAPGTGKTHLASALGRRACEKEFEVRFYRVSHLVEELETALSNGRLTSFRKKLEKVDVIILDEMGYVPFGKDGAELLFHLRVL